MSAFNLNNNKFKRYLLQIFFIILFFVSFQVRAERHPTYLPNTCMASSISEINNCIRMIQVGSAKHLKITTLITCRFKDECKIDLSPIGRRQRSEKVVIYGQEDQSTGFERIDFFDYPFLTLENISNIEISSLRFIDDPIWNTAPNGMINILNSSEIKVDSCIFENPKFAGIANRTISNVNVTNSKFLNSSQYGIWISEVHPSESYNLKNNEFNNGRANAVLYSGSNGEINNNLFTNNHSYPVFGASGGQLLIEANTQNTHVFCNLIKNGFMQGDRISSGIELARNDINNVNVHNNWILNNDGYAAYVNHEIINSSNIVFNNNFVRNNLVSLRTGIQFDYFNTDSNAYLPTVINNCTETDICVSTNCGPIGPDRHEINRK